MLNKYILDCPFASPSFSEYSSNFLQMKRTVQPALADALYHTISQWISAYPSEFIRLQNANKRLDGSPDILFDILHSISQTAEGSKIKSAIRPCKTLLLVLCPDLLRRAWEGGHSTNSSGMSKKAHFMDIMKKAIKANPVDQTVVRAYIDICATARLLPPDSASNLASLEQDMGGELRVRFGW